MEYGQRLEISGRLSFAERLRVMVLHYGDIILWLWVFCLGIIAFNAINGSADATTNFAFAAGPCAVPFLLAGLDWAFNKYQYRVILTEASLLVEAVDEQFRLETAWEDVSSVKLRGGFVWLNYANCESVPWCCIPLKAFESRESAVVFYDAALNFWKQARARKHRAGRCGAAAV